MSGTDYSLPEGTTDTTSTGVTLTSGEDFEVQDGGTTYDTDIENGATEDVLGTTALSFPAVRRTSTTAPPTPAAWSAAAAS
jgi:hypothetical protein